MNLHPFTLVFLIIALILAVAVVPALVVAGLCVLGFLNEAYNLWVKASAGPPQ